MFRNHLTVSIVCKHHVFCYFTTNPDSESTLTPDQRSCFITLDPCIIKNLNLEDKKTRFPEQTLGNNVYFVFPGTFSSVLHLLPLYLYKLLIRGGCVS